MPTCELCGREEEKLTKVNLLGSALSLCSKCRNYGEEIPEKSSHSFKKKVRTGNEEEVIVNDAPQKITKEMNKHNINAKTLGRTLGVKESTISKMVNGKLGLDIPTARKIENHLGLTLVEKVDLSKYMEDDSEED